MFKRKNFYFYIFLLFLYILYISFLLFFTHLFVLLCSLFHGLSSSIFFFHRFVLKYWIYADSSTHFWFTIDHGWTFENNTWCTEHQFIKRILFLTKIIISLSLNAFPRQLSYSVLMDSFRCVLKSTYDIYQSITIFTIPFLPFYLVKIVRSFIWTKIIFFFIEDLLLLLLDNEDLICKFNKLYIIYHLYYLFAY